MSVSSDANTRYIIFSSTVTWCNNVTLSHHILDLLLCVFHSTSTNPNVFHTRIFNQLTCWLTRHSPLLVNSDWLGCPITRTFTCFEPIACVTNVNCRCVFVNLHLDWFVLLINAHVWLFVYMFKTIKVGVRVHMYSYKDLSSWKPHGLLTCLFYLLSRCAGLKTTLKYSNNSTDVIIDSDGELFMYRYCIKVEGEDLLT